MQVTADQVRDLVGRLGDTPVTPVFAFDAGYDPIALTHELADVDATLVVRIRDDRVFYTDPGLAPWNGGSVPPSCRCSRSAGWTPPM